VKVGVPSSSSCVTSYRVRDFSAFTAMSYVHETRLQRVISRMTALKPNEIQSLRSS
jgi:hypothetical protein